MAKLYTVQKGDNLTKIAQKFGYSDYQSAGVKSVPSGDWNKINVGDQITLDNVKDDAIPTIPKAPIIASSKALAGDFYNASSTLDNIQQNQAKTTGTNVDVNNGKNTQVNGQNQQNTNVNNSGLNNNQNGGINNNGGQNNQNNGGTNSNSGDGTDGTDTTADNSEYNFENDPMYKLIQSENQKQIDDFKTTMDNHIQEFKDAYKTDLSQNSSTYASAEATANATFERSSKLLTDILMHNQSLARMNGSSGGFGEANIMATNAGMSANEMDYAHEIQNLSLTRNQLIQEAAKARDAGDALALKNKITNIADIEDKMVKNMQTVAQNGLNKLKTLKELSAQKQKELQEKRTAMASSYAIQYLDDYEKATTDEDRNKIVANIVKKSNGTLTTADVFNALNKRSTDKKKAYLDELETNAKIKEYESRANNYDAKSGFSNATDPAKGIFDGIDITSYATKGTKADPNYKPGDTTHEQDVGAIYNNLPDDITTSDGIQKYINAKYPKSPLTGQMIMSTANKYGVSPKLLVAMIANDSSMGTAGKAVNTKNAGNVGNDDKGNTRTFASWEAGVDAVGEWLAKHKTVATDTKNKPTKKVTIKQDDGTEITLDNLPIDYQTEYEKAKTPEEKSSILDKIASWFKSSGTSTKTDTSTSTQKTAKGFTYSVVN